MDALAYHTLRDLQDRHWWFVGRRAIIETLIRRFVKLPKSPRILEAGCGYGGNLEMLGKFGDLNAFEYEDEARAYASALSARPVEKGFLPDRVGFDNDRFELIAMLDVLEHIQDDAGSLRALRERLSEDGSLLITVPAMPWLWSEHDEVHHHKRRYTKATLQKLLKESGYELVSTGYFNTLLFPLALLQRLAARIFRIPHRVETLPPRPLNGMLSRIFGFESRLVGRLPAPVGLSLYAVARQARA